MAPKRSFKNDGEQVDASFNSVNSATANANGQVQEEPGFMASLMSIFKKDDVASARKSTTVVLRKKQGAANNDTDQNVDQENNPNQQNEGSKTRVITIKDGGVKDTSNANEENKTPMDDASTEVKQQAQPLNEAKGKKEKRKRKKNRKNAQN